MRELVRVLTQAPRHDTTKLLRRNNIRELARNQRGRVPRPEDVDLLVPVVLAAGLVVRLAVLLGAAPGVCDGDALAGAVVGEAACLAEVVSGAAGFIISDFLGWDGG